MGKIHLMPFPSLLQTQLRANQHTPDMNHIAHKYARLSVFVWGTEKQLCRENSVLKQAGAKYIGNGFTGPAYVLRVHKKENLPLVFYNPADPAAARIFGEVFSVTPEGLFNLDSFYNNTVYTQRRLRQVDFRKFGQLAADGVTETINMWMYTAIPDRHQLQDYREAHLSEASRPYYNWRLCDDQPGRVM